MGETERRALQGVIEFRKTESGLSVVEGVALRYGETSEVLPGLRERFAPGAFGDLNAADIVLNFQHERARPLARTGGGGLTFTDGADALQARAELDTETADGNDAARLLRRKVLRGFSIEFAAESQRFSGGVREVRKAALLGLGLVDRPAHTGSEVYLRALAERCKPMRGGRVPWWTL